MALPYILPLHACDLSFSSSPQQTMFSESLERKEFFTYAPLLVVQLINILTRRIALCYWLASLMAQRKNNDAMQMSIACVGFHALRSKGSEVLRYDEQPMPGELIVRRRRFLMV